MILIVINIQLVGFGMADYKVPGEYSYKKDMIMSGVFPADVLDRVPDFQFYPEDILIQTYPKSG